MPADVVKIRMQADGQQVASGLVLERRSMPCTRMAKSFPGLVRIAPTDCGATRRMRRDGYAGLLREPRYSGIADAFTKIKRADGVRGFWTGTARLRNVARFVHAHDRMHNRVEASDRARDGRQFGRARDVRHCQAGEPAHRLHEQIRLLTRTLTASGARRHCGPEQDGRPGMRLDAHSLVPRPCVYRSRLLCVAAQALLRTAYFEDGMACHAAAAATSGFGASLARCALTSHRRICGTDRVATTIRVKALRELAAGCRTAAGMVADGLLCCATWWCSAW